jgi:streptogramin lyase
MSAVLLISFVLVRCNLGRDHGGIDPEETCDVVYSSVDYVDLDGPSETGAVALASDCHHIYASGRLVAPQYLYRIDKTTNATDYKAVDHMIFQMRLVGDYLWTVGGDAIQKIDKNTLLVVWSDEDAAAYDDLRALGYDGTYLWAADRGASQMLHRIDPATNAVVSYPGIVAAGARHFAFDGAYLWLTCSDAGSVTRIDPGDRSFDTIAVPGSPWGICWDGTAVIVAGASGRMSRIDPVAITETDTNTIAGASWLCHCAFDGDHVWIADNVTEDVKLVDPDTLDLADTRTTSGRAIVSHYDGRHVWVVSETSVRLNRF